MKAMVYTREGGLEALQIRETPRPSPDSRQVLIEVKAGALNVADCDRFKTLSDEIPLSARIMNRMLGLVGKPIGAEISGVVVEAGAEVVLRLGVSRKRFAVYVAIGLAYLAVAYAPIAAPGVVFGIVGTIMAVFIVLAIVHVPGKQPAASPFVSQRELQLGAYFFFATAAHMLWP